MPDKQQQGDHAITHGKLKLLILTSVLTTYSNIPLQEKDSTNILKPQAILDKREVQEGERNIEQVLVQWEGLPPEDATWISSALTLRTKP